MFRRRSSAPDRPSPAHSSRPRKPARHRTLRLESLEPRLALAILGLDFRLLSDNNGAPGAPLTDVRDESHQGLQANDFFWVEILAWDQRAAQQFPDPQNALDNNPGVISLPLNLSWSNAFIQYVSPVLAGNTQPLPVPQNNTLVTPSFPEQRLVDSPFQPATSRQINDLRGAAGINGFPIGEDGPEGVEGNAPGGAADRAAWFSRLRFQALQAGTVQFDIGLAGSMSFTDADTLDDILHLVRPAGDPNGIEFESAGPDNTITEEIVITAELPPEPQRQSLSGFVYADTNVNGLLDRDANGIPTELGLPNVTLQLFDSDPNTPDPIATTTTGPDGWYNFEIAAPGTYRIVELQPAGFVEGTVTRGLVIPLTNATPVQRGTVGVNQISEIQINAGDRGVDFNFGENLIPNKRMFLTSTRPAEVLCEELGVDCVTVEGTAGNDQIVFSNNNDVLTVTVNGGTPQEFPVAGNQIVLIDALAGTDTVTLNGTSGTELAHLIPGRGTLRRGNDYTGTNFAVLAINAESVIANGGTGADELAVIDDSPVIDALVAGTGTTAGINSAILSHGNLLAQATAFDRVRAITPSAVRTAANPQDTSNVQAVDYVLELVGDWTP